MIPPYDPFAGWNRQTTSGAGFCDGLQRNSSSDAVRSQGELLSAAPPARSLVCGSDGSDGR